ncbi:MAG: sugar phosphate nucleotidyltransferase [Oscillospiraceae bacterium]|nr:sugar phosphate nucleotidyltransferase [Oscillospiraceae bacterium]
MIIMAGGSGTRLWPLSRTYYPKQFIRLSGMDKSIFQMTIDRCLLMGDICDIYIVAGKDYVHLIKEQLLEMEIELDSEQILLEPRAKNTLPAILYAVQAIRQKGDDICAVFASDHVIEEPNLLAETMIWAKDIARKGIVCFGITPDFPNTGYGYIKPGKPLQSKAPTKKQAFEIAMFREKPDTETAKAYIKAGYFWNSGLFMFDSREFVKAVEKYSPDVYEAFGESFGSKSVEEKFEQTPSVSVDYGLIEKLDVCYCVPLSIKWNDLGTFTAFYDRYRARRDMSGNVILGDEIMIESSNNLVYSKVDKAIALIGVDDIIVVDLDDALLICHRDKTQLVKEVVEKLCERNDRRVDYLDE